MVSVNSTMLPLGTPVIDFALPDPAGKVWTFDAVAGEKGTLVAFVCNHCPYVRHIAETFAGLAEKWQEQGIGIVAINSNDVDAYPDDAPDKMETQAREWNWRFPYVSDADQSIAKAYNAACTPDFYLFDAAGTLVYRGRLDESTPRNGKPLTGADLGGAIDALLAGAPIDAAQSPSIGCNIKWRTGTEPEWFGIVKLK